MISVPATQQALKIQGAGKLGLTDSCTIPHIQDDEVLVRVICVAINPVDAKSADLSPSLGATLGCDFSGEVASVGGAVKRTLSVGDRVCGCVFGNNPDERGNGAFGEFVAVAGDLVFKLPSGMSYQLGASLGVGLSTVGMALYHILKLPLPLPLPFTPAASSEPSFALVYGGGTATGGLAIQMLRKSGLIPITTCSPHNFESVKALGAIEAFDYHSASCGADIRSFTRNSLVYALDCITDTGSMEICYAAIGSNGGKYLALDPFPVRAHTRRNVKPNWIIAFTMFNKPINWQRPYRKEAKPKDRKFAEHWFQVAQGLLDSGAVVPHPIRERSGGLKGVIDGVDMVRKGEVSGVKLVYRIQDDAGEC